MNSRSNEMTNMKTFRLRPLTAAMALAAMMCPVTQAFAGDTATPIKHVIVVVGENHTFDNLFGTYAPKADQNIDNLLSKGIVNADGTPGANFHLAKQNIGVDTDKFRVITKDNGNYDAGLPQPYTTYAIGQTAGILDSRFPSNLPNGPFQISNYVPYNAYTGDPVHRFFQMWQGLDGGKNDKFVWVEESIGTGSNGKPYPAGGFNPKEGAISMGFFNMSTGDAPIFKSLADEYAISDNYHQAIQGGTGANFQAMITADAAYFTDPNKLDGTAATPWSNQIENPDPVAGTNNYYTQDGYGGGSYVNCADAAQPGVAAVNREIKRQGVKNGNCEENHYYLVNNYNMYWNQTSKATRALGATSFTLPPQSVPTIADKLTAEGISWKYYSADRGDDATVFAKDVNGVQLLFHSYCGICDPLTGYNSIMTKPAEEAKLQNYGAFLADVKNSTLPEVSYVRPFEALAGHPADSNANLYELFLQDLIERVQGNPALWSETAIIITTDEGGGYYDSGYVQAVDFFGDGTRIPLLVVSPYAKKGHVDHTYSDHASILKFIEKNWKLSPISSRSRDNLPNPVASDEDPYQPENRPAIGDLTSMFDFGTHHHED
jgi:phospholipase C